MAHGPPTSCRRQQVTKLASGTATEGRIAMDVLTPEQRRRCMSAVRGRNTGPEKVVRKLVHALGYRYRLHCKSLPGQPDLVFSHRRKVIFVHGCFWHRHRCKRGRSTPVTRRRFWLEKFDNNKRRDARQGRKLRRLGWRVLVVWECQTRNPELLAQRILRYLESE